MRGCHCNDTGGCVPGFPNAQTSVNVEVGPTEMISGVVLQMAVREGQSGGLYFLYQGAPTSPKPLLLFMCSNLTPNSQADPQGLFPRSVPPKGTYQEAVIASKGSIVTWYLQVWSWECEQCGMRLQYESMILSEGLKYGLY